MSVLYIHLTYEHYREFERQCRRFKETSHTSTGGFYHKSIRLKVDENTIMEFHGPLVGGYGHNEGGSITLGQDAPPIDVHPEGGFGPHVVVSDEELAALKEKAWQYDQLCN